MDRLRTETVPEKRIQISGEADIVASRQHAREMAARLGFSLVDQSRIATAVSELARNVVRYATGGQGDALVRGVTNGEDNIGIEIVVSDSGPGIENVEQALRDGFTSANGLGLGLPGAKRLMDELRIESAPGSGTIVTIRKWRR